MIKISEADFNLLSALIDNELNAEDKAQMLKRLQSEEPLQKTFVELQQLKDSMQASYKQTLAKKTVNTPAKNRFKRWPIAATLGLVSVVLGVVLSQNSSVDSKSITLAALHQSYSKDVYQIPERNIVASFQLVDDKRAILPDLSQSNLFLVAQQSSSNAEQVMHYRGVNGCKLTFRVRSKDEIQHLESKVAGTQQYQWFVQGQAYQVIATGMDQQRFDAIASYIQQLSENAQELNKYQMAMQSSYQTARPCS